MAPSLILPLGLLGYSQIDLPVRGVLLEQRNYGLRSYGLNTGVLAPKIHNEFMHTLMPPPLSTSSPLSETSWLVEEPSFSFVLGGPALSR